MSFIRLSKAKKRTLFSIKH